MKSTKDLEERIKQREKQADDRNIAHKIYFVCHYLGEGSDESFGAYELAFKRGDLSMKAESHLEHDGDGYHICGFYREVKYKNRLVYKETDNFSGLDIYKPGKWEEELDRYYVLASKRERNEIRRDQSKKSREKKNEINARARNFGL